MCGIFGVTHLQSIGTDYFRVVNNLAHLNSVRGNRGFGALSISSDSEVICRFVGPYDYLRGEVPIGSINLFHLLAPTGEVMRIHPFETDRFVLAHNGILLNHRDFPEWYLGPVDSQYILGGIQKCNDEDLSTVEESIIKVNSKLNGQRACWLWDRDERVLYLWRVMSPLWFNHYNFVFSSAKIDNAELLEEGRVYKIKGKKIEPLGKFEFYSPYLV